MTDSAMLAAKISDCGYTLSQIAAELGITRQGLWKKINNRSEFKQSEIEKISNLLNLDTDTNREIFFKACVV